MTPMPRSLMKVRHVNSLHILIALAILIVLSSCSRGPTPEAQGQNQAVGARGQRGQGGRGGGGGQAVQVRAVPVQRISVQRLVDLAGTLVSPDQVRVSSEVGGVVASITAELGQEVRAGQVLIQLDTRELELALARAESALRQTEAQLGIDSFRSSVMPP